jgi:hypothetical protein
MQEGQPDAELTACPSSDSEEEAQFSSMSESEPAEPEAEIPALEAACSTASNKARQQSLQTSTASPNRAQASIKFGPLKVSEGGWIAQQRLRRSSACLPSNNEACSLADFARKLKGLLNKLSIEKFEQLSSKLTAECQFTTTDHVQVLIEEIFERATTQHHFIDMYTDLCELLNKFFDEKPVSDDPKCSFKRLLLNECQRTFERNLQPPQLPDHDLEERTLAEVRYKTRMLGNIRFVGALLARHMMSSKVLVTILEELMSDPKPEAIETLAALLRVTGSTFDTRDWAYFSRFDAVLLQLKALSSSKSTPARVRCLLLDVFDLRARGWTNSLPTRMETPTTLKEVAEKKAKESSPVSGDRKVGRTFTR